MQLTAVNAAVERRVEEDGSGLLFDADTEEIYVLNSTGIWLWHQLQPGISLSGLVERARSEFNIAAHNIPIVSEQIADLLLSFYSNNLITLTANNRPIGR